MSSSVEIFLEDKLKFLDKIKNLLQAYKIKRKIKILVHILELFVATNIFFSFMMPFSIHADDINNAKLDIPKTMKVSNDGALIVSDDRNPNLFTQRSAEIDATISAIAYKIGGTKAFEATAEQRLAAEKLPFNVRYGMVGSATSQMLYALYDQPGVNLPSYLAYEWSPTYHNKQSAMAVIYTANGYQFLKATGIAGLWNITRNMSYLFLAIILVVSGFMVMFRQKINGQVMVSVYNTIPNIIVSLILITFSFAIVGLLININTTIIYSLTKAFFPAEYSKVYYDGTGNGILTNLGTLEEIALYIMSPVQPITKILNTLPAGLSIGIHVSLAILLTGFLTEIPIIGPVLGAMGIYTTIIFIITFFITLIAAIKVYFAILKQYFMLLLNIVLMPLSIAFGALPGQGHLIKDIFLKIIKNLLSMQFITFFVNLAIFLSTTPSLNVTIFKGVYLSGNQLAVEGKGTSSIIRLYLFFYLLFFAANSPNLIDDWLKTNVGKGAEKAVQMTSQQMGKIPVVGSLFKKVG